MATPVGVSPVSLWLDLPAALGAKWQQPERLSVSAPNLPVSHGAYGHTIGSLSVGHCVMEMLDIRVNLK
jgi:hypothetical protein